MKTEEIQARLERGYTMAVYGTRENIHEQMTNDIKMLLEAINYTRCSTQLKSVDVISFEEWKKVFVVHIKDDLFELRGSILSSEKLRFAYSKDVELYNSLIV